DFRALLRSNLISQKEDFPVFDTVFDCFWREQSYERIPMETLEIQGTPTEMPAKDGGDEEGLEEAVSETIGKENVPLENLEEFSVPTYSPQEQLNRKDFSEMGVEESRAIARAILLIATKIATQISRRKKRARKGNIVDLRWTMRNSMKYGGANNHTRQPQAAHKENQGRTALRRERLYGLLQSLSDPVHVRAAERALGGGDFCIQHFAEPHYALDSHQGHHQCLGKDLRQYSRMVWRDEYWPLAADV